MGNIADDNNSRTHNLYSHKFLQQIKYYAQTIDPITSEHVTVYSFQEIFVHKLIKYFSTKKQMLEQQQLVKHLTTPPKYQHKQDNQCKNVPMCLQTIYYINSKRYIQICADKNYKSEIYQEHFNYTLKQHLQALQIRLNQSRDQLSLTHPNIGLSKPQLFYIIKQLAQVGMYLDRHQLIWNKLHTSSIYIDAGYEIRVPVSHIRKKDSLLNFLESNKTDKYFGTKEYKNILLAPQQLRNGQNLNPSSNISRVFSLGLIILECYNLLDSFVNYYYSPKTSDKKSAYQINLQKLNKDIKLVHNDKLASILSRMLQVDPHKRICFSKLYQVMSRINQNQIQNCLIIQ